MWVLKGFDSYVNIVLEDVTFHRRRATEEKVKLDRILLNGNNICMLVPTRAQSAVRHHLVSSLLVFIRALLVLIL